VPRLWVEADRSVYYEHYRRAGGPTVVLLHGWGSTARVWDSVVPAMLDRGHSVVTLDQRCHGRSDMDFEQVSVAALVSDVLQLVDHLELDRVLLNGWSMGGTIALDAGLELSTRLAGLVLTCSLPRATHAPDWPWGMASADFAGLATRIRTDRLGAFYDMAAASIGDDDPQQIEWGVRMKLESGPRAADLILDLVDHDSRSVAAAIGVPVLVVGAEWDKIVTPEAVRALASIVPRSELAMIAKSGHTPMLEAPVAYAAALCPYVDRLMECS